MHRIVAACALLLLAATTAAGAPSEPRVSGRLQLLASDVGGMAVDAARIGLSGDLRPDLAVRAGLFRTPYGRRIIFRLEYLDRRAPRPGAADWNDDRLRLQGQLLFG